MANLSSFLKYLGHPQVTEVILQTGEAVKACVNGKFQPLTERAITLQHVEQLLQPYGIPLPTADGAHPAVRFEADDLRCEAEVLRRQDAVRVVLRRQSKVSEAPRRPIPAPETPLQDDGIELEPAPRPVATRAVAARPAEIRVEPAPQQQPQPSASPRVPPSEGRARQEIAPLPAAGAVEVSEENLAPFVPIDAIVDAHPMLQDILQRARERGASDVHLMSGEFARVRLHGALRGEGEVLDHRTVSSLLLPLLSSRGGAQLRTLGYADFACNVVGGGRVRVNISQQRTGLKGCFRLHDEQPRSLETLGLPAALQQVALHHQGLVIVAGPNGAGKTTTLAALIDMINSKSALHIITIEDPIEIVYPIRNSIVSQREVGMHTIGPHTALKAALREDPDIIVIGELRDRETVEKSLEAAETGHLVLATMSTPSGATTIDRLVDMFPPDDQNQVRATLAGALKFVISQRLVPKANRSGRVAAIELITGNIALWNLIKEDKLFQLPSLLQRGQAFGMIRLEDSLSQLVRAGTITLEEARAAAGDPRLIGEAGSETRHG